MKISVEALARYIDIAPLKKDLKGVLEKLTLRGLEVESVTDLAQGFEKVVVAQVLEKTPHPNATRLSVCRVDSGKEVLQIVCGAQNFKAKDKVALSLIGAKLPNGLEISKNKIRDVESFGMLCSESELGMAEESEGILILQENAVLGTPLAQHLGREDTVFEINVTPNRGDALCLIGVARELALITGQELKVPRPKVTEETQATSSKIKVTVDAGEGCLQYHSRYFEGIKVGPSPAWLKKTVEALGMRSINNIVDVTNFVMLELGVPLHAFDYDQLKESEGTRHILVRKAKPQEQFKLLDKSEIAMSTEDVVITDSQKPVALAGVMGGADSEVTEKTARILLEAAEFQPSSVRKTSKKYQKRTEASHRYERNVDSLKVEVALDRAAELFIELAQGKAFKGKVSGFAKGYKEKLDAKKDRLAKIEIKSDKLNKFTGLALSETEIKTALKGAGFEADSKEKSIFVKKESFRPDVEIAEDVYEEVLRVVGYDTVAAQIPSLSKSIAAMAFQTPLNMKKRFVERLKTAFTDLGFSEAVNFAFSSKEAVNSWNYGGLSPEAQIVLKNPLNEEFSNMKTSLLSGLFQNVLHGFSHQIKNQRLFEVRPVFFRNEKEETGVQEENRLAAILTGKAGIHALASQDRDLDFFDAKGLLEQIFETLGIRGYRFQDLDPQKDFTGFPQFHPYQTVKVLVGPGMCGVLGRLNPQLEQKHKMRQPVFVFELSLDKILSVYKSERKYAAISKFPKVQRDFSFVISKEFSAEKISQTVLKVGKPLVESVSIVDVFEGGKVPEGMRSVSISAVLGDPHKTLEEKEIEAWSQTLLAGLDKELSVKLRLE